MNRILTTLLLAAGIFSASRESLAYRDPAPLSHGPGSYVVYAVADDGWGLFRNAWVPSQNNWGGWTSVTAPLPISNIAVASFEGKEVIFIQAGNNLLTNLGVDIPPPPPSCPNCLSTWEQIDTTTIPPALVNKDQLTVYFKRNGSLRARRYGWANGFRSWQPATSPGTAVGSDFDSIAVGKVNSSDYMLCGGRGTQYICSPQMGPYADWPSGSWSTLPGVWNAPPSVNTYLGLPMVFGRGFYDNQLYSVGQFFGWETPVARGGNIASRPAGLNVDSQQTHIFAKAGWNNTIWYTYQVSGNWGPWHQMP